MRGLVQGLDERLDERLGERLEGGVLAAIEARVASLSERLDGRAVPAAEVQALGRTVDGLAAEVANARAAAQAAAEAARSAVALREDGPDLAELVERGRIAAERRLDEQLGRRFGAVDSALTLLTERLAAIESRPGEAAARPGSIDPPVLASSPATDAPFAQAPTAPPSAPKPAAPRPAAAAPAELPALELGANDLDDPGERGLDPIDLTIRDAIETSAVRPAARLDLASPPAPHRLARIFRRAPKAPTPEAAPEGPAPARISRAVGRTEVAPASVPAPAQTVRSLDDDVPLEPGSGRPDPELRRRLAELPPLPAGSGGESDAERKERTAQDFIARARRAAAEARGAPAPAAVTREGGSVLSGLTGTAARLGATRKPLLLAAAGIALALGVAEAARTLLPESGGAEVASARTGLPEAREKQARLPAREPAPTLAAEAPAPVAAPVAAPAAREASRVAEARPQARVAAIDPAPTGALGEVARDFAPARTVNADVPLALGASALRAAAAAGDAAAEYEVGARFLEGRGLPRDPKGAASWLVRAADQGLVPAQFRLAGMLDKGNGLARDPARARALYLAAAERGHARSMHNLAVLLAEGADGKPDYAGATRWFRAAAEHGVRDSQFNLAILLARGLGGAQDLKGAYLWLALAAAGGDPDAITKRDEIAPRLPAAELAALKRDTAAWKPRPTDPSLDEVPAPAGGWDGRAGARTAQARPDAEGAALKAAGGKG